jgi:hypothetical protein
MTGLATDVFVFAAFDAAWWRLAWRLAFAFAARLCVTALDDVCVTGRAGVAARVVTGALETGALGRTVEDGAGVDCRGAGVGAV